MKKKKKVKAMKGLSAGLKSMGPAGIVGELGGIINAYDGAAGVKSKAGQISDVVLPLAHKAADMMGKTPSGKSMGSSGANSGKIMKVDPAQSGGQEVGDNLGALTNDKMIDVKGAGMNWAPGSLKGRYGMKKVKKVKKRHKVR